MSEKVKSLYSKFLTQIQLRLSPRLNFANYEHMYVKRTLEGKLVCKLWVESSDFCRSKKHLQLHCM